MVTLALYKKRGRWTNRLISWRTSSPYSHCEIVVDGWCISSSGRDHGVRLKRIDLSDGWDLINVPWADAAAVWRLADETLGKGYDYLGVIIGAALGIKVSSRDRWFCSEWCAAALGFAEPWRFTPADLYAACAPWRLQTVES